ncbi:hypothetical protein ASD53_09675 [Lysobacter sp. Root559]|nr:hypothetical protein ASD53_09675 [Lysobacter sp. Root559]KRC38022.1 hypothetical protein ASE10_00010 [Lysobacter sp. Root76]KRD69346.1 hypothetical protein ASE45_09295 [Lysobacter sp. Root96]
MRWVKATRSKSDKLGTRDNKIVLRLNMLAAPQELQEYLSGKLDGTRSQLVIRRGCLHEMQWKSAMGPNA